MINVTANVGPSYRTAFFHGARWSWDKTKVQCTCTSTCTSFPRKYLNTSTCSCIVHVLYFLSKKYLNTSTSTFESTN